MFLCIWESVYLSWMFTCFVFLQCNTTVINKWIKSESDFILYCILKNDCMGKGKI